MNDDEPEPSGSRDRLLEQADAAHERAVRRLQDDVRLVDRFHEAERGSKDVLLYRINKRPTQPTPLGHDTKPGLGSVIVPLRPERPSFEPETVEPPKVEPTVVKTTERQGPEPAADPLPPSENKTALGLGPVEPASEIVAKEPAPPEQGDPPAPHTESPPPGSAAPLPPVSIEPRAIDPNVPPVSRKNLVAFALVAVVGIAITAVVLRSGPDDSGTPAASTAKQEASAAPLTPSAAPDRSARPAPTATALPSGSSAPSTEATTRHKDPPVHGTARPTSKPTANDFPDQGWGPPR